MIPPFVYQFNYGNKQLNDRYTVGTYWEQSQQNAFDYLEFKKLIERRYI